MMQDEDKSKEALIEEVQTLRLKVAELEAAEREYQSTETALRKSEKLYRLLAKNVTDVITHHAADGTYLYVSPSSKTLFGYDPQELLGQKPFELIHPDDKERLLAEYEKQIQHGDIAQTEYRHRKQDGTYLWVENLSRTIRNSETEEVQEVICVIRDISERIRMEQELREYKKAVESSEDMIAAVSKDYVYLFANAAFLKHRGMESEQVVGHTVAEVLGQDVFEQVVKSYCDRCLQGETIQYDMTYTYPELGERYLSVSYYPLKTSTEDISGFVTVIRDITESKQAENALRESEKQLKELNASKDTFFSIIAHDLKNPLIAFLSFANLLDDLEKWGQNEIRDYRQQFRRSADNLFALLENLLTWSRVQRGMIDFLPQHFHLDMIIAQNLELLKPNAEQKQMTLRNSVQETFSVFADIHMITTVIRNLVTNALKFTQPGGTVEISARQTEHEIEVSVSDTGIGIPEDKLPQLFRIDTKYKRRGTAKEKGTGLGF